MEFKTVKCIKWIVIIATLAISPCTKSMEVAAQQQQIEPANLDIMPQNVIEEICKYLPLKNITDYQRLCKTWQKAWDHERTLEIEYKQILAMSTTKELSAGLKILSERLNQYRNPVCLYLTGCNLTELPAEISNLKMLKKLHLGGNPITQSAIAHICNLLPQLEELILYHRQLKELPVEISNLKTLKKLNLRTNALTQHAIANICNLPQLEELDLSVCNLRKLPVEISNLRMLKKLHLGDNMFTKTAIANICNLLPQLEELYLLCCSLTELPVEISNLKMLKKLDLVLNSLSPKAREQIRRWLPNTEIKF